MQQRILITGADGSLGQDLSREFWDAGYEVIGCNREQCDITDRDEVFRVARETQPSLIINAAAYNNVDKAEDPEQYKVAYAVNALGPKYLAEAAKELNVPFVHYSTDYVFGGDATREYREDDEPNPVSKYGESKAAGEKFVKEARGTWYICRASKLFGRKGISADAKPGFCDMMRRLAKEKPEVRIVDEEGGMPTYTRDIARATRELVEGDYAVGVYHLVNSGPCVTWYQFAEEIFSVEPTATPRFPVSASVFGARPARRPSRVALTSTKFPLLRPRIDALKAYVSLPKVSLVIVSLNVRDILAENLRTLFANGCAYSFEVIVVDNGSEDGTPAMLREQFPQVRLVQNAYNSGFAHACNQGSRVANGEVVIFFNPDMRLAAGAIEHTCDTLLARREIGVMGIKLVDEKGAPIGSVRRDPKFIDQLAILLKLPHWFPSIISWYMAKDFDYDQSCAVEQVRGSYFAMRRDVLNAVGPWDEQNFFIWFEEIDLCRRVRDAGYVVWYSADANCVDLVGATFKKQTTTFKQFWFSRSMVRYFRKWHPAWQSLVLGCIRPFAIAVAFIGDVARYKPKRVT